MKPAGQLNALTGIRILAAAAVFLSHLGPLATVPEGIRTFMAAGYNGVTLFFILSGFVLTWSWGSRILPVRGSSLWAFFVARFARIYPVYLFALLVAILPYLTSGSGDRQLMLLHTLTLQPWSSHVDRAFTFNGPAWSIGVEVFLYACFPLVIFILAKLRHSKRALLAVATVAILAMFALAWWFQLTGRADLSAADPQSAHRWLYRTPLTRLGDFTLGVIAALLVQGFKAPRWLPPAAQLVGAASIVLLMCNPDMLMSVWSWDAAYMLPAVLLIWGLAAGPWTHPARLLGTKPMVIMGQASFAFYLLHALILGAWTNAAFSDGAWWGVAITQFAVTMFLAIGLHFYLEEPVRKWLIRVLVPKKPAKPVEAIEPETLVLTP